ncbi:hypothetical protein O4328_41320 [Rhodococcus opacus]|uniref:Uncharacterized protein n=1 Tax=Rhodococcus opacus TaxID=37919 RepID=A0AAX3Y8W0_RHOOP|nr:hypothetical protein [Rhodococcus opacus]MCZ4590002.1 hypothetical protein [Rhodococcus opacus]WLF44527.1 hypothetical protein Q5707_21465 [Rhodococcus opacus]
MWTYAVESGGVRALRTFTEQGTVNASFLWVVVYGGIVPIAGTTTQALKCAVPAESVETTYFVMIVAGGLTGASFGVRSVAAARAAHPQSHTPD